VTALRVTNVSKSYGAVRAVRKATLGFWAGRIHAVVGENGAGKSTLLKMAAGIVVPDEGEVVVLGSRLSPHTAREAIRRGVGMVQQHFALVPVFTALENVVLGSEPVAALGRIDYARARTRLAEVERELGVAIPHDAPVETLGVGDRQRLEIARAVYRDARVLILDEPTAVLTPGEADALYATARRLADSGRAVIVVTHKLDEVRAHADVASVMRRGELVATYELARAGDGGKEVMRTITDAIMGGHAGEELARGGGARGTIEPLLSVRDLAFERALRGVTFDVGAGEICGVAGVEGNGQRELVRILAGLELPSSGGAHARGTGIAVVHEDRHQEGLVLEASVRENLLLGELRRFAGAAGWLALAAIEKEARSRLEAAGVVPPDLDVLAGALSGGNQQKIVVERAVAKTQTGARVLVVAHPTRGVDLGAARVIHKALLDCAARGVAVLVVSADLAELRALCDRILVMSRGRIVAELPPTASDRELGRQMLGEEGAPSAEAPT
jgi:simple sugar transport system ATP-binding protein